MINQMNSKTLARKHLDEMLSSFREASAQSRPPRGWVRAIRNALGMTTRQLADRMNISQPTLTLLEQGEEADSITLKTLRHAAEALDCQLVYALVPKAHLQEIVHQRARAIAKEHLARTHHSMLLEDQAVSKAELEAELERLTAQALEGRASRLWEAP